MMELVALSKLLGSFKRRQKQSSTSSEAAQQRSKPRPCQCTEPLLSREQRREMLAAIVTDHFDTKNFATEVTSRNSNLQLRQLQSDFMLRTLMSLPASELRLLVPRRTTMVTPQSASAGTDQDDEVHPDDISAGRGINHQPSGNIDGVTSLSELHSQMQADLRSEIDEMSVQLISLSTVHERLEHETLEQRSNRIVREKRATFSQAMRADHPLLRVVHSETVGDEFQFYPKRHLVLILFSRE